ncbi:hypothetical protein [Ancylobacter amanitiformis]|uniref:HNH endonuclease n=1 Tax=Ancylobacter amanitiformis TaxID=217069 RepID=A0ABU0LQJ0_9HYPH|nr:hypothetical protein [Ancylobacter amanitiformis]MDQ0510915.1 hypothetical protein [Ancylobacter amanitiformis]
MTTRLQCCVPFCRRTTKDRHDEWVCGKHWSAVPQRERRRLARAGRWYRKRFGQNAAWTYPAGSPKRIEAVRFDRHWRKCWERCKRAAIEAAGGIG